MTRVRRMAVEGVLAVTTLAFITPILLMLLTSVKPLPEINAGSLFDLPREPTFAAWLKAWGTACIGSRCTGISAGILNSFAIVVPALITSLALGALTGYALSLRASRFADFLFLALLASLFVPAQVTLFPMTVLLRDLGLFGTRAGIVLVHTVWGLPFVALLFRNFFLNVPREILRAARMDGADFFGILRHVMLPMSVPICVVAAVLQFTFLWNDFLFGLMFAGSGNEPVTVMLSVLTSAQYGVAEYNVHIASAMISAAPTILLYIAASRLLIRTSNFTAARA